MVTRSPTKKQKDLQRLEERKKKKKQEWLANKLLFAYSYHDLINKEIVFTNEVYASKIKFGEITITNAKYPDVIRYKINEELGYVPEWALNHEYGEVLNVTVTS